MPPDYCCAPELLLTKLNTWHIRVPCVLIKCLVPCSATRTLVVILQLSTLTVQGQLRPLVSVKSIADVSKTTVLQTVLSSAHRYDISVTRSDLGTQCTAAVSTVLQQHLQQQLQTFPNSGKRIYIHRLDSMHQALPFACDKGHIRLTRKRGPSATNTRSACMPCKQPYCYVGRQACQHIPPTLVILLRLLCSVLSLLGAIMQLARVSDTRRARRRLSRHKLCYFARLPVLVVGL